MKLLSWEATNGKKGFCCARCYNRTTSARTTCICQGHNKGVGLAQAIEITRVCYTSWVAAHEKRLGAAITFKLAEPCKYTQQTFDWDTQQ